MPPCHHTLRAHRLAQTLAQAGFFYAKLRIRPTAELDRMRSGAGGARRNVDMASSSEDDGSF